MYLGMVPFKLILLDLLGFVGLQISSDLENIKFSHFFLQLSFLSLAPLSWDSPRVLDQSSRSYRYSGFLFCVSFCPLAVSSCIVSISLCPHEFALSSAAPPSTSTPASVSLGCPRFGYSSSHLQGLRLDLYPHRAHAFLSPLNICKRFTILFCSSHHLPPMTQFLSSHLSHASLVTFVQQRAWKRSVLECQIFVLHCQF